MKLWYGDGQLVVKYTSLPRWLIFEVNNYHTMRTIHQLNFFMKNLRKSTFLTYLVIFLQISCQNDILKCGTVISDIEGNTYNTVQIGEQCWMKSNLKVSKYRNRDNIPTGLSNSAWQATTSGAYAIYNNDPVNDGLYGKLYNHYAVTDSRGLCPKGWHVPSDAEWTTLENQLGGSDVAGGALKSTATQPTPGGWNPPNTGATNSSGFTALPGGLRNGGGDFNGMANHGCWWSSSVSSESNAWDYYLYFNNSAIYRYFTNRSVGFSVRCCRDKATRKD